MSTVGMRQTSDSPWCWQSKEARRRIRERMNGDSKTVYVLSAYDALTEIASDESSDVFRTSHPYLAAKAGFGISQLKVVLADLVDAGLVRIETPKVKGPCTFTMLSCIGERSDSRNGANDSHVTASDSRNAASVSHKPNSSVMATVEESQEERSEEQKKNSPVPRKEGPIIPDCLKSPEFDAAWQRWKIHRQQIRKRLTDETAKAQLKSLARYGLSRAVQIIDYTVEKGWQGLADEDKVPISRASPSAKQNTDWHRPALNLVEVLKTNERVTGDELDSLTSYVASRRLDILAGGEAAAKYLDESLSDWGRQFLKTAWKESQ